MNDGAQTGRSFAPDPTVLALLTQLIGFRSAACMLFVFAGLAMLWVGSGSDPLQGIGLVFVLLLIARIASWRAQAPRSATAADYDDTALRQVARMMDLPTPSVLVDRRPGESVRLRGTVDHPVLMVSPLSLKVWRDRPRTHMVTIAHELGHAWMKDLSRHFFVSTAAVLVMLQLTVTFAVGWAGVRWLIVFLVALCAISLRAMLRSREHSADMLAAQLLGREARDAIPNTDWHGSLLTAFLGTHPPPPLRRQVFDDLQALFIGMSSTVMLFGAACTTFVLFFRAGIVECLGLDGHRVTIEVLAQILFVAVGATMAISLGWLLAYSSILVPGFRVTGWMRSYLIGVMAPPLLLSWQRLSVAEGLALLLAIYLSARVLAAGSALSIVLAPNDPAQLPDSPSYVLAQTVLPFVAWMVVLEGFRYGFLLSAARAVGSGMARLPLL